VIILSNEQRAHDITMLYVKLFTNTTLPDENGNINIDIYSKYKEIYPVVLEEVNKDFQQ
jgi:hypothetical protein